MAALEKSSVDEDALEYEDANSISYLLGKVPLKYMCSTYSVECVKNPKGLKRLIVPGGTELYAHCKDLRLVETIKVNELGLKDLKRLGISEIRFSDSNLAIKRGLGLVEILKLKDTIKVYDFK